MTTETALKDLAQPKILARNYRTLGAGELLAIITGASTTEKDVLLQAVRKRESERAGDALAGMVYRNLNNAAETEAAGLDFSDGLTLAQVELLFGPLEEI